MWHALIRIFDDIFVCSWEIGYFSLPVEMLGATLAWIVAVDVTVRMMPAEPLRDGGVGSYWFRKVGRWRRCCWDLGLTQDLNNRPRRRTIKPVVMLDSMRITYPIVPVSYHKLRYTILCHHSLQDQPPPWPDWTTNWHWSLIGLTGEWV